LAEEAKAYIIPVHIKGTYDIWPSANKLKIKPGPVEVVIGKPISPDELNKLPMDQRTELVRQKILRAMSSEKIHLALLTYLPLFGFAMYGILTGFGNDLFIKILISGWIVVVVYQTLIGCSLFSTGTANLKHFSITVNDAHTFACRSVMV
jgi:hypothetical protein